MALRIAHVFFWFGIFCHLAVAGEASSASSSTSIKKSQLNSNISAQQIPIITNEAEYAAWAKRREEAERASSGARSKVSASKTTSLQNVSSTPRKN